VSDLPAISFLSWRGFNGHHVVQLASSRGFHNRACHTQHPCKPILSTCDREWRFCVALSGEG